MQSPELPKSPVHHKGTQKLTFQELTLCQSVSDNNCVLNMAYMLSSGVMPLVEAW